MNECPQCGSKKTFEGRHFNIVSGMGPQYFRPRGLKLITTGEADITIPKGFTACAECGLLWNRIDTGVLRKVIVQSGNRVTKAKLESGD